MNAIRNDRDAWRALSDSRPPLSGIGPAGKSPRDMLAEREAASLAAATATVRARYARVAAGLLRRARWGGAQ